jgi:hypothetical protein
MLFGYLTEKHIKDRSFQSGDCWIWNQTLGKGRYPVMTVRGCGCQLVRRLSAMLAGLEPEKRQPIESTCDDVLCVNPRHMVISSTQAVAQKAADRGAFSTPERRRAISKAMRERFKRND